MYVPEEHLKKYYHVTLLEIKVYIHALLWIVNYCNHPQKFKLHTYQLIPLNGLLRFVSVHGSTELAKTVCKSRIDLIIICLD